MTFINRLGRLIDTGPYSLQLTDAFGVVSTHATAVQVERGDTFLIGSQCKQPIFYETGDTFLIGSQCAQYQPGGDSNPISVLSTASFSQSG